MTSTSRFLHVLSMAIFILVTVSCGSGTPSVPTLDPNAIGTAIAQTLASQPTGIDSANTPVPTETALSTATVTVTEIAMASNPAEQIPIPLTGPTAQGASCIPNNPAQTGTVIEVVDGDTIKVVLDQDGQIYTVRYIGMDTPESTTQVEYFGVEASAKNSQMVLGKTVTLMKDVSETDRFGRLLRYVIVDDLFINYELVAQGYASTASFPPDIACIPIFQQAEQNARASSLGLWNAAPNLVVLPTQAQPTVATLPTQLPPTLVVLPTQGPAGGGGSAVCNCSGPDLDCGDFSPRSAAQPCFDYCVAQGYGDIFRLDRDSDGQACEG